MLWFWFRFLHEGLRDWLIFWVSVSFFYNTLYLTFFSFTRARRGRVGESLTRFFFFFFPLLDLPPSPSLSLFPTSPLSRITVAPFYHSLLYSLHSSLLFVAFFRGLFYIIIAWISTSFFRGGGGYTFSFLYLDHFLRIPLALCCS